MADLPHFSTFGGLSASEIAIMQSGASRRRSHPIALYDDDLLVPAPARPGRAQPSASFFDPFLDTLSKEKRKGPLIRRRPSVQVHRDWPQRPPQTRPPQPHQFHQPQQGSLQQCPQQPPVLCPRQRPPSQRPPLLYPHQQFPAHRPTVPAQSELWQGLDRPFPFKREYIRRIFKLLSEMPDSQLPVQLGPHEPGYESHPRFCAYHQLLGHALEDCLTFKEWLRRAITEGSVVLPAAYLVDPPASSESFADCSAGTSDV